MLWFRQNVGPGPRGSLESINMSVTVKRIAMSYSRFTVLPYRYPFTITIHFTNSAAKMYSYNPTALSHDPIAAGL